MDLLAPATWAGALAAAVCKQTSSKEVLLSDKTASKAEALAEKRGCMASDSLSVAGSCRYLFLGVKPQMMEALFSEIRPVLQKRTDRFLLVTMAAGLSMDTISRFLRRGSSDYSDHAEYAGCRRRGHDFVYGKSPCVGS